MECLATEVLEGGMESLPTEVLEGVLACLSLQELASVSRVCRRWAQVARRTYLHDTLLDGQEARLTIMTPY